MTDKRSLKVFLCHAHADTTLWHKPGRCPRDVDAPDQRWHGLSVIISNMKQELVLQILKQKNAELSTKFGVNSLLLFGSVARNEATPASDVDLLVEFNRPVGYFGLFALQDYLEKLLGCPVDLGTPDSLKPYIKERIKGELIRVT